MGIKMPTVDRFLFCLTLETGGLVLGYFSAIFSAICIFMMITTFAAFSTYSFATFYNPSYIFGE